MSSIGQSNEAVEKTTWNAAEINGGSEVVPNCVSEAKAPGGNAGANVPSGSELSKTKPTASPDRSTVISEAENDAESGNTVQYCNANANAAHHTEKVGSADLRRIVSRMFCWLRPANWLIAIIVVYKYAISPWLPPVCRFEPSCSMYAMEALRIHGLWRGSWLAVRRVLRCNPFCKGGYDPVPPKNNENRQTASGSGKTWRNK